MKRIAVFTSGGDSPGMNACIRAVVRTATYHHLEVFGIMNGYEGMIDGHFVPLGPKDVSNIIQRGGTILKTARSKRFHTVEGRAQAIEHLRRRAIDGIIAIGGDGTFRGACDLMAECDIPIIGLPGTIDNDLVGTDYTIGYDTAINTVVEAVDRLRDTAESHNRMFIVEVMGKDAGLIALRSGIGSGAEAIFIPETKTDLHDTMKRFETGRKDKSSCIMIVAEGDDAGGAYAIAKAIGKDYPHYDVRVSVLGHIQRGGRPTCMDRVLAGRLGFAAVEALLEGRAGVMAGVVDKAVTYTALDQAVKHLDTLNPQLLRVMDILSR